MKLLFQFPISIYIIATLTALGIMIIVDFVLGAEAEHLNAWSIINQLFGWSTDLPDSLAIQKFGLLGASFLMLAINSIFGALLIHLLKGIINLIHAF